MWDPITNIATEGAGLGEHVYHVEVILCMEEDRTMWR